MINAIPKSLVERIIPYPDDVEWRRDAQYGAPMFAISGTTGAAVLGVGTASMAGPWAARERAMQWDGDRAAEEWAADKAAGKLDDGLTVEPFLLAWIAEQKWDRELLDAGSGQPFRVRHPDHEWLRVSPDGLWLADGRLRVPDAKCPYGFDEWADHGTELDVWRGGTTLDSFPLDRGPKHLIQAYLTLACIPEAEAFEFVVCLHIRDTRRIVVHRDAAYQEWLVNTLAEWRERYLVGGEEPEYDESVECVRELGRKEREDRREADEEETVLLRDYRDAGEAEKAGKTAKTVAKRDLLLRMNETKTKTLWARGDGKKPGTFTVGATGRVTARLLETI